MQMIKKKWCCRFIVTILSLLLLAGSFNLVIPGVAVAEPSNSLEICGDGVTNPTTFTLTQLQAMDQYQQIYSAINTWPTKKWYVGEGVKLAYLLDLAGIKDDAKLIKFTSNDGYSVTLTVKELLKDKRYYFPHFKDSNAVGDGDGNVPGSPADKQLVEPMIAQVSVEGSNNPKYMNDLNTLLLMMGQRSVTEQNGNLFVKYLSKVEVLTTEPQKWDSPQANPDSGEVPVGTMVALSNVHMDDDKVYYTTDGSNPTVDSPMYNWIAKRWWSARADVVGVYNHPIGPITKNTTIKAITIGPGKLDSDVVTFTYTVPGEKPAETETVTPDINDTISPDDDSKQTPVEPSQENLTDIKSHWAEKNIKQMVAAGTVGGYPDGTFKPNNTITRAEFATMLVKAFKLENEGGKIFADTANHWAKDYIARATVTGIVSGYDANTFGPNNLITREQMAVMIAKAAKLTNAVEGNVFTDGTQIADWAKEAVAKANGNGIISGYPDNTFRPRATATRAEAITVIVNALNK
jgi:hypothetical protein